MPSLFWLNAASSSLSLHLKVIFFKSLEFDHFPTDSKCAIIKPLHKVDYRANVKNYRPHQMRSVAKIFGFTFSTPLFEFFRAVHHNGFFLGRSRQSNLNILADFWCSSLNEDDKTDAILIWKWRSIGPFYSRIIIEMLRQLGIDWPLIDWSERFLTDRNVAR